MKKVKTSKKIAIGISSIIAVIVLLFTVLNQFYIDYLWFSEVGYTQVFLKELITKLQIGIPLFIVLFFVLFFYFKFINIIIKKAGNIYRTIKNKILISISLVISLFITLIISNTMWYKFLEFFNASPFNVKDPIFNKDISFYIFKLPLLEQLYISLSAIFFILLVSTAIYSAFIYLAGNKQKVIYNDENQKTNIKDVLISFGHFASKQIGVFLGIFFILFAFNYYIKSYTLLYSTKGLAYGASYTDMTVALPLYRILMVLSIVLGLASIIFGLRNKIKLLAVLPVILIIASFAGGLVNIAVENFIVAPNQYSKEEPYLINNIQYTKQAYNIDKVETVNFSSNDTITADEINENEMTIKNIPINDYRPTLDMYNSIQGFRIYYQFNDIDIDRYKINDAYTQVFISAREMNNNKLEENAKTWINQHLKYTHGYGVAVSPVNQVNDAGQPSLVVKDIPPKTDINELSVKEPRIYFGESTDSYAITNCKTMEFDYPEGSDNVENYYSGNTGIKMNLINRLAFSLYHGNMKILLSSDITSDSKMLINRNITDRVSKIAPFLSYDEDPYITVADGKLYWIIDGFTKSNRYPYAQPYDEENSFNYMRNSVKVVVDAYNGDVTYYQVDDDDPITNVYKNIYPDLFKSFDDMPQSIKEHVRYSQNMFDIQANIYGTYHMNNPRVFYNKEDKWEIATQIYGQGKEIQDLESEYLIMKQPKREEEEFILMVPYTPREKDNMVGWLAAMNDQDDYGKLLVYAFPKQNLAYGPMQIEQRIDQDTVISPQLTLLGQQGSQIIRGNMLTIPINDTMLYVEPIYIGASGGDRSMPEVKKVIASYNNKIVMENSLEASLAKLFGSDDEQQDQDQSQEPSEGTENQDLGSLISEANELFQQAQEAQKNGNWADYGKYIDELQKVLSQLNSVK